MDDISIVVLIMLVAVLIVAAVDLQFARAADVAVVTP